MKFLPKEKKKIKIDNYIDVNICDNEKDWDKTVPNKYIRNILFEQFMNDFPICTYNKVFLLNHFLLLLSFMDAKTRKEITGYASYKDIPIELRDYCYGCWCCCSKRDNVNNEWSIYNQYS